MSFFLICIMALERSYLLLYTRISIVTYNHCTQLSSHPNNSPSCIVCVQHLFHHTHRPNLLVRFPITPLPVIGIYKHREKRAVKTIYSLITI
ncbi:hypothetical protein BDC45DRAFT_512124 [Circinella umbellata]|nr:hypothetical protein BDC45DRAFT_512124 [Circinella umbellata]